MTESNDAKASTKAGVFCGHVIIGALALALAAPSMAQSVLSPDPLPGATTCAEFMALSSAARLQTLTAIQPLGDDLESADPAIAAQWSGGVASACARDPNLPLADAAAQAIRAE
jgi:hypothetical protein